MISKPWLAFYDEGVPHSLAPYPQQTLLDVLREIAIAFPLQTALIFEGTKVSYQQLDTLSGNLAMSFIRLGIQKGDRLALIMPTCIQALIVQLAAWKAGAIVVPLNPLYHDHEMQHFLVLSEAKIAVTLSLFYQKVKSLQPKANLQQLVVSNIKEYLPPPKRLLFTLIKEKKDGHRVQLTKGDLWLQPLLGEGVGATLDHPVILPDDPALLLSTGGTTGKPKLVICSHQAIVMAGKQFHAWSRDSIPDLGSNIVWLVPIFHAIGNIDILGLAFYGKNTLIITPNPRDTKGLVSLIKKYRPDCLPAVPAIFDSLLKQAMSENSKLDLSCLKLSISGATFLPPEIQEKFEQLAKSPILHGYGLTEVMGAVTFPPAQCERRFNSAGIPLPDIDIRIVDPENGKDDCPIGQVGEVIVKAPQLMSGYWRDSAETDLMIRKGWLYSGDLGYMDQDGFLFIIDRKKDVIKPAGFQVWPQEVENAILQHSAVAEVGVAGIPDEHQGEAVKAWVVIKNGEKVTPEDIRQFCRNYLVPYKVPRFVEFCTQLPRTHIGKVIRSKLGKS